MATKKKKSTNKYLKVLPDGLDSLALAHELSKLPEIYDLPRKWRDMAENLATPKTAPIFMICAEDLFRILMK